VREKIRSTFKLLVKARMVKLWPVILQTGLSDAIWGGFIVPAMALSLHEGSNGLTMQESFFKLITMMVWVAISSVFGSLVPKILNDSPISKRAVSLILSLISLISFAACITANEVHKLNGWWVSACILYGFCDGCLAT